MVRWRALVAFVVVPTVFRPEDPSAQVGGVRAKKCLLSRSTGVQLAGSTLCCRRLRSALDYSGFGPGAASRPSHPDTPRRPFVQAVLSEGSPLPGTDKAAS